MCSLERENNMNKLFTKISALVLGLTMSIGVGVAIGSGKVLETKAANTELTFSFTSNPGSWPTSSNPGNYTYTLSSTSYTFALGTNVYYNSSHYLMMKSTTSLGLPAISGKKLTKVVATNSSGCSTKTTVGISTGTSWSEVSGGAKQTWSSTSTAYTYNLTGTAANTMYYLHVSTANAQVTQLALTYADTGSSDYVGSLSVSPSTWTGYDSQTLTVSSFTVSGSKNGTDGSVTSSDYEYKGIGYMSSGSFVARDATFSSGSPTTADTRLAWKAKYPTTAGGSTYAWAYVTLDVTADSVNSIAISGSMTKKTYNQGDAWDPTGFTVNAYYASAPSTPVDVTNNANLSWSYSPATTASTSTTSVTCTASFGGKSATSSAQSVTINEKTNLGGIVDGEKYFIIANGYYLQSFNNIPPAAAGTAVTWPGDDNMPQEDTNAWTFTSTGSDDNWVITSKGGNTLYATATNNGLGCTSSGNDNWTVIDSGENGLKLQANNGRYLTCYPSGTNFRTYTSTSAQDEVNSTIRFVKYVAPASITSVEFTGDMTKKEYYVGDSWDYSGISLQANKDDETSEDLGSITALIESEDLEIEASPAAPGTDVTSVTISGVYGDDLLEAEITITGITVSSPRSITGVSITGDMTNKSYTAGDPWDYTGLNMTVTYNQGQPDVVALSTAVTNGDIEFTPSPANATMGTTSLTLGSITHISYEGEISDKVITGISVSAVPGRINFGTTTGYWNPTESGATTTDNLGSSVEITSNSGAAYSQQGPDWKQIGTNDNAATEVLFTITLTERSGIDALSIKYAGAATRSNHAVSIYGDTAGDAILSGSISGSSTYEISTGQEYTKINANTIHVKFTGNVSNCGGIKLFYIQYTLGTKVQEFGTLDKIEIDSSSTHETTFKLNQTFSSAGLKILATDTTGFTKLYSDTFTTSKDGVTFNAEGEDIEVVVTLIVGGVTKTCSYTIDVINPPTFEEVTTLYEGMRIYIGAVYNDNTYLAGSINGKYLESVSATLDGDTVEYNSNALEFTVEYYGFNILFRNGSNYLKCNGDKNITLTSEFSSECVWSLNEGSLICPEHAEYEMKYNGQNPRFTTYSTGSQTAIKFYVSSATPETPTMIAATFAQQYLHMRDYTVADGSCLKTSSNHYYTEAKEAYTNLTPQQKTAFAGLTDAVARLQAWASANNETFNPSTGFSQNPNIILSVLGSSQNNNSTIIIIITIVSLSALGGYFYIRRRKEIR